MNCASRPSSSRKGRGPAHQQRTVLDVALPDDVLLGLAVSDLHQAQVLRRQEKRVGEGRIDEISDDDARAWTNTLVSPSSGRSSGPGRTRMRRRPIGRRRFGSTTAPWPNLRFAHLMLL